MESSGIESVEELAELLSLWREITALARLACTNEGTGEQDDGEDDEQSVLDSRHHGSSGSVVSDRQWRGRRICRAGDGQI